eukprot:1320702-Pyramimonas_sp.AAC.1
MKGAKKPPPPLQSKAKSETPAPKSSSDVRPKARSEDPGLDVQMEAPRSETPRPPIGATPAQVFEPKQQPQDPVEERRRPPS